jgi:hypothetical protein
VLASIGSVGDAYDNALAESFVDSFKTELIADRVRRTRSQLELAMVEYVGWFNHDRLHEAIGDLPPAEFEQRPRPADPHFGPRSGRGARSKALRTPPRTSVCARRRQSARKRHSPKPRDRTRRLRRLNPYMKIGNHMTRSPRNLTPRPL